MSRPRSLTVLAKDLRLGPRSPVFLLVLVLPLVMTLLVQTVFGSLFARTPRLGIVDEGDSEVTAAAEQLEGIHVRPVGSRAALRRLVEDNDLDAGLVLPVGFDGLVREGKQPPLEFYVAGQSLASQRVILTITTIELVRAVKGEPPPVEVVVRTFGEEELSLERRLLPLIIAYALVVAAVFLPAFSLADEREKGTLAAMLVTPLRLRDVIVAKGLLGIILAVAMTAATLVLNGALGSHPFTLLLVLLLAAFLCVEVGLIYGTAARDIMGVFALIKATGILLLGPTIFYVFPEWPRWIAKLFPTYWVINPLFETSAGNAGLASVAGELLVAGLLIGGLLVPLLLLVRRLQRELAVF